MNLEAIQRFQRIFLQVPKKSIVSDYLFKIPDWWTIDVQQDIVNSVLYHCKTYPPSKKWLRSVLKDFENAIIERNEEISDSLAELIIYNFSREDDDDDPSYVTFVGRNSEVNILTYRSHNDVGTRIWEAGLFLAEFCSHILTNNIFNDKHVLGKILVHYSIFLSTSTNLDKHIELGAGVGVTGLILSKLFSVSCKFTMTDNARDVLCLLEDNIKRNYPHSETNNVIAQALDWDLISEQNHLDMYPETPDLILAADCTYSCDIIVELVKTIRLLLAKVNNNQHSILMPNDLELQLPCALVACTLRNTETYNFFLSQLALEESIQYLEITEAAKLINIEQEYYYENRQQIRLIYISPKFIHA